MYYNLQIDDELQNKFVETLFNSLNNNADGLISFNKPNI